MRPLQILLVSCLPLIGQVTPSPKSFANLQELKHWAEKNSWGGLEIDEIKHAGVEAVIVRRSSTSGITTCSLSVFIKGSTGLIEALKLREYAGYWIGFSQKGDSVTLFSNEINSAKQFEIMRFSISSLALQSFEK